ncbi:MAG: PEP-CTERM sorting domain-containing protein, partial [Parvularculaceae bacterium]
HEGTRPINGSALASGGLFPGNSTPATAGPCVANGSLWDISNFDLTALFTLGINNLTVSLNALNDALSAIVAAVNLPAGAAPPDPDPIPVPPAALLLLTGAGALAGLRRRRQAAK